MDIFQWIDQHPLLPFTAEQRQQIARAIHGLYDENRFDKVRTLLDEVISHYRGSILASIELEKHVKTDKEHLLKELHEHLISLKSEKMIEPERALGTIAFREKLAQQNIPMVPFYAVVEFQAHVTEQQKERLEAALAKVGILDSLLTLDAIKLQEDAVIRPQPQLLGYTLADFLQPDMDGNSGISSVVVDEVLRSIPISNEGEMFSIDEQGHYTIGCLVGHAPYDGPSKFIGRTSRKRYQQEKIQETEQRITMCKNELMLLEQKIESLHEQLIQVQAWLETLPSDKHLQDLQDEISSKQLLLESEKKEQDKIDETWKKTRNELMKLRQQLREISGQLNKALTKEVLEQAIQAMDAYRSGLSQFIVWHVEIRNVNQRIKDVQLRLDEIDENIEEYHNECIDCEQAISESKAKIKSIEQQLQLEGIEQIRQRIETVQTQLKELNNLIYNVHNELPQAQQNLRTNEQNIEQTKKEVMFWQQLSSQWQQALAFELELGFIPLEQNDAVAISAQFKPILQKYERSKLLEQLSKSFLTEQAYLTEYRMMDFTEDVDKLPELVEVADDTFKLFVNEFDQKRGRRIIQMEYRGQRVSPYYLHKVLNEELIKSRHLLDEQDRELYEDIIVNSVGTILRRRIERAGQWVKEMDQIMASRDNSSGLLFSISWKPLTAETEDELDTRELIQLLQRNSKFLNEEDLNKITKHFRSRIERAKELISLRNEGVSLHQVLKEVLDYRKWFTFILSFSRVNEKKRELTNNAFFRFSGGEKAMAMYIPLFTAAYSRYKEAHDMAPYIISLDEAFAGVDEQNIRDMFEVVEQLGFNYIMNSQALWGDYDTVPSLSIAEIVRPKNADFVTVIPYKWNGKQRMLSI
ncbi:TIGR02680 family protein [Solibacillus sp. FSL H8-0538]|uniref:TIGR02680 family protein n=1 Tax=Solibacillus sp. FSL H8-0538 TaxID=2921400 RepID=UPI0030F5EC92